MIRHPIPFVLAATDQGAMIVSRLDVAIIPGTDQGYGVGVSRPAASLSVPAARSLARRELRR